MEFKRGSVIALYLAGKPQVAIVRAFPHLNVNKSYVSRTIACYRAVTLPVLHHVQKMDEKKR